ncbi:unnamed protein product [Closterium sp. NIES-53]
MSTRFPPLGASVVDGMWIFRVKRPPGSPPVFKAHYVARCFSQREGVHFFETFAPTLKMTTLPMLLHVAAQRDYELHSLDFSTAFLQGSLHEEVWLRPMAAQELCWLTFLLTDLGERPSSEPTLFTDNKETILLSREPQLESRVKHINVMYFLPRELQRR